MEADDLLPAPDFPDLEDDEPDFEEEALGVELDLLLPDFLDDELSLSEEELFLSSPDMLSPFKLLSEEPIMPEPEDPLPMLVVGPEMPAALTPVRGASEVELLPGLSDGLFELEVWPLDPPEDAGLFFCCSFSFSFIMLSP